jgi:hypothetical protein
MKVPVGPPAPSVASLMMESVPSKTVRQASRTTRSTWR